MNPEFFQIHFTSARGGWRIDILQDPFALRCNIKNGRSVRDMRQLVQMIHENVALNNYVRDVVFVADVEMPSHDDFALLCMTLIECGVRLDMLVLPYSPVDDVYVGMVTNLIWNGVVLGIRVPGGLSGGLPEGLSGGVSAAGALAIAQTIQSVGGVRHLDIDDNNPETFLATITRPIDVIWISCGVADRVVNALATQVLVCNELNLNFGTMTLDDLETLAVALTRLRNTVQKLSLRVGAPMDADAVQQIMNGVVAHFDSELRTVNISVGATHVYVYPRQSNAGRNKLQALFVMLSARQVPRVGAKSQLRRIPSGIMRGVAAMTVRPGEKF